MPQVSCSQCGQKIRLSATGKGIPQKIHDGIELRGMLHCLRDGHRWPITMLGDEFLETSRTMPITESVKLYSRVRDNIREDVEEAEACHYAESWKASVMMCRRAIQIGLEDLIGVHGQTLGPLLILARHLPRPLLTHKADQLADRIHNLGDEAAHGKITYDPKTVEVVIHDTVMVLNELYA